MIQSFFAKRSDIFLYSVPKPSMKKYTSCVTVVYGVTLTIATVCSLFFSRHPLVSWRIVATRRPLQFQLHFN